MSCSVGCITCYADYVSSTGHIMVTRHEFSQVQILNLRYLTGAEDDGIMVLAEDMDKAESWQLSAYSGSITFLKTDFTVVVRYYQ